eukprot:GEZU01025616.1.p1 GENE.GEZU01025616.1~~GEZU01025616.1.p1  ORF type:complete len:802 (-),score=99.06 GEZU01025616.1:91-2496(-)
MSSEVYQYEQNVKSIAVDFTGTFLVLGARKGLFIANLDSLQERPKVYSNESQVEVGAVQWCPHSTHDSLIACTVSHDVQIWDINLQHGLVTSFQTHARSVSDVCWSPFEPNVLATCSADTYIHLWDTRQENKKPIKSFCAWTSGATQVKWNKFNQYVLASAHEGEVRIWDTRKGATHSSFITAHMGKINGIDWSTEFANELVTCGQDRQAKVWNIDSPTDSKITISNAYAILGVRYTPFGNGLITVNQWTDFHIRLWGLDHQGSTAHVVHSFKGHSDVVKTFDFRNRFDDYQLISWSNDKTLRVWTFDQQHLEACGFKGYSPSPSPSNSRPANSAMPLQQQPVALQTPTNSSSNSLANRNSGLRPSASLDSVNISNIKSSNVPNTIPALTLSQECAAVEKNIEFVTIEEKSTSNRSCVMKIDVYNSIVKLRVTFPQNYPYGVAPSFEFLPGGNVPLQLKQRLRQKLMATAQTNVAANRACLQAAVESLVDMLQRHLPHSHSMSALSSSQSLDDLDLHTSGVGEDKNRMPSSESPTDARRNAIAKQFLQYVPAPPTMVACFSPTGHLIYFNSFPALSSKDSNSHCPRSYEEFKTWRTSLMQDEADSNTIEGSDDDDELESIRRGRGARSAGGRNHQVSVMDDDMIDDIDSSEYFSTVFAPQQIEVVRNANNSTSITSSYLDDLRNQNDSNANSSNDNSDSVTITLSPNFNDRRVHIYDMRYILPISFSLASQYEVNGVGIMDICQRNALLSLQCHQDPNQQRFLYQMWQMVGVIADRDICIDTSDLFPWAAHPFARQTIQSM